MCVFVLGRLLCSARNACVQLRSYTGLNAQQVAHMTKVHHVYLLPSGRISMAGVNSGNVDRLAAAIDDAVRNSAPKL